LKKILFRVNAGKKYGLGHLSRCLCLAEELIKTYNISFIIKSDNELKVTKYIHNIFNKNDNIDISYINSSLQNNQDISIIIDEVKSKNAFLIVDHYDAKEEYQKKLFESNINWLQFDSHALINFYATFVLHGSPDATLDKYLPLLINKQTNLLLGTDYSIVSSKFKNNRKQSYENKSIKKIMICFGGGNDNGATYKCLSLLDLKEFSEIIFFVVISDLNEQKNEILKIASIYPNVVVSINESNVSEQMNKCDLAIISPGTLSYEAACIGLPMVLISIADNQMINATGWLRINAAKYLGAIEELDVNLLNQELVNLNENIEQRIKMYENCKLAVDGNGTSRIKYKIDQFIYNFKK
jgi:UDP-2,4-diacetamido-2,4,6-trideoxy-beta-L-altropyranose hydrolase